MAEDWQFYCGHWFVLGESLFYIYACGLDSVWRPSLLWLIPNCTCYMYLSQVSWIPSDGHLCFGWFLIVPVTCICHRWLGFRLETVGGLIVFSAAIFAVVGRGAGGITGGLVGLSISYALQVTNSSTVTYSYSYPISQRRPCRVGSVGIVSASRTVGREFASWPGHTKDHHKNGTNCLPA